MERAIGKCNRERCDSEENSVEDFMKRKREMLRKDMVEEEENIFKRSNKTVRSPGGREAENDLRNWSEGLKEKMRKGKRGVRK